MRYNVPYSIPVVSLSCITVFYACRERYEPPVLTYNPNYLVVDGFLNNGSDSTFIRLSRARKLDSNLVKSGEKNAELSIEDKDGNPLYFFSELNDDGMYTVPGMSLDTGNKYHLRIKTVNGKQYLSDEIKVQQSPQIDSISWRLTDKGLTVYTNTHDPLEQTKYYRWDYTETWQYHAAYSAQYYYLDYGMLVKGHPDYYECWKTLDSKLLLLASSEKLDHDIIFENPIRFIPLNSIELSIKYSILVRQYTLTKEAYQYYEQLRKSSEQTGSIFDAQPSELTGNIHSVNDPAEIVIGFVTACTIDSKRIYIQNKEVDPWFFRYKCGLVRTVLPTQPAIIAQLFSPTGGLLPIEDAPSTEPFIDSLWTSDKACVDCRLLGGFTTKPNFWP